MAAITTTKVVLTAGNFAAKHKKKIAIGVVASFLVATMGLVMMTGSDFEVEVGTAKVNEATLAHRPVVEEMAEKFGIPEYVDVILAIIMTETGGDDLDVMQSSESLGLPPGTITDPNYSIEVGVSHFAEVIQSARKMGLDFWTPVQAYNYGGGFNNYVEKNGKKYSFELASSFAQEQSGGTKVDYSNPVADFNGNWRYKYGNMYYVNLIQSYLSTPNGAGGDIGNADASPLGMQDYQSLMNEVQKYNGWAYVWGGSKPGVGFDCSGLTQWAYGLLGYKLPRTAAEQHQSAVAISDPQPGDLIFFKGTNPDRPANSVTHVGIYVDENRMYDASSSGVGYHTWSSGYWKEHLAGFGRVAK
ncbi:NlpC/P60 family protein [Terribacillus saccharophilus]|uniref:NlpC/P60 family protein n=1 Tax=Terribacillus saccharophilus TaxID=361277 RepID=A0AAX2EJP8_9BACI|nr:NlpC/P60 family protein [Terribacillus saccharophilus]